MKKTKRRRPILKLRKGGSGFFSFPSMLAFGVMIIYGFMSVFIGPAYLIAEILNIPVSSLNNFSRKSFNNTDKGWLHRSFGSLVFDKERKMKKEDFLLQEDMHIHQNVAVVSNDSEPQVNGQTPIKRTENAKDFSPDVLDSLKWMVSGKYGVAEKRRLRLVVYKLFSYIENIRATDEERKIDIKRIIDQISDYKSLIKCYLIYKTIDESTCKKIRAEKKTILKDEDVVTIVNPFYNNNSIGYTKRIECVRRHVTQKRFKPDDATDQICKVTCDTCTFRNSISRLAHKYISSGAWLPAIALIASGLAYIPAIAGITAPAVAMVASGASIAATSTGLGGVIGATTEAIGSVVSGAGMVASFITGSTVLLGGATVMALLPPDYANIVKQMLNTYFNNIKIENGDIIKDKSDEQLANDFKAVTIPIHKLTKINGIYSDQPDEPITSNILAILDKLKVSSHLVGKLEEDDKDVVLEKFNRFMCKYDIMDLVKWRIVKLYSKEAANHSPSELLKFILNDSMR